MRIYVAIKSFNVGESTCIGAWANKSEAIAYVRGLGNFDVDFTDSDADEPFFGTEEMITVIQEVELEGLTTAKLVGGQNVSLLVQEP